MSKNVLRSRIFPAGLIGLALALTLVGCNKSAPEPQSTVDTAAQDADLKAREAALAAREAEVQAKEQAEEARKQADEAARLQAEAEKKAAAATKKAAVASKAAAKTPAQTAAAPVKAEPPLPPVVKKVTVPAGTQLTIALASDLSSKTAKAGDSFEAKTVSDIMIGDRIAVPAGSRVAGTITDVVSGSRAIGAVPMLGLKFDTLSLEDGQQVAITGDLVEQGKSEKGRDTAKILGGAAAGAILGHQVKKGSSGKVLGGLLGGAVGAVAAKKTGTEVQLASGSTLTITTGHDFTVKPLPAT